MELRELLQLEELNHEVRIIIEGEEVIRCKRRDITLGFIHDYGDCEVTGICGYHISGDLCGVIIRVE